MESLADFLGVRDRDFPDHTPNPAPRFRKLTPEARAREILESHEYLQSVADRIRLGTLHPSVEIRLHDMAYGKPTTKVEVTKSTRRFADLTVDQLEDRAMRLLARAKQLRGETPVEDSPSEGSVH